MALKPVERTRVFNYAGMVLPDPNPNVSPAKVKEIFCARFAELATASIEGPVIRNAQDHFSFKREVGTKG